MEISKVWAITQQYEEIFTFEEDLINEFIKYHEVEKDEDQTIEEFADEYAQELWDFMEEHREGKLDDLFEYQTHEENLDGEVVEYRFDKN